MPPSLTGQIETFLTEIQSYPIFAGLNRDAALDMLRNGKMRSSRHREVLFSAGETASKFALVLRGAYKLVKSSPKGDDVIMSFSGPGEVVAALIMAQPEPVYPVTVVSMGPSLVLEIPRQTYLDAWMKNPNVLMKLQNFFFSRMALLQDHKLMAKSPLPQKVASLLLQLMAKYSAESEMILPIPLTRKEIADSLGATVESTIRIMSDWSHQGIISTTEQHIEILSPEKLIELLKET